MKSGEKSELKGGTIGRFIESNPEPTKLSGGREGDIYLILALTPLTTSTGLYTFLDRAPAAGSSSSTWVKKELELEVGEILIWCGEQPRIDSAGGGGVFLFMSWS